MRTQLRISARDWRTCAAGIMVWCLAAAGIAAAAPEIPFTIVYTNDEHSAVVPAPLVDYHPEEDNPATGGFARLNGLVNGIRAAKADAGEPVVLVSAGDILGGTPYAWLMQRGEAPEIGIMQRIGYDVITIGNHEFDYGSELLGRYYQKAGYPAAHAITALVCSNLVIPAGHPLDECGILDTHLISLDNGLRLGFFGLLGVNAAELAAKMPPVMVSDPVAAAARAVQRLREQDADVIIAVTHAGLDEDRVVAAAVPGIHVMVTGHYHPIEDELVQINGTHIVKAGAFLQYLGVLELAYEPETGAVRVRNEETGQPFLVPIDDDARPDPAIAGVIQEYTDKLDELVSELTGGRVEHARDTVMHAGFTLAAGPPRQETNLGNFVTDAMRLAAEEWTGERVDFAIQANGVIRGDVSPGAMPHSKGTIVFYDLATAIGLGVGYDETPGYPLASIHLTGKEIYRMLELSLLLAQYADIFFLQVSGARVTYDPARLILFRIPGTKYPVPSLRAVLGIERFTGSGPQSNADADYAPIPRGDPTLYHVVCDYYILSFIPRFADLLPVYKVVPKDRDGRPIAIRDAILENGGSELKFWQAVVAHAATLPPGNDGSPRVPDYYARTGARIVEKDAYPLILWGILLLNTLLF
jgi:UDP-sugar diphosphatase